MTGGAPLTPVALYARYSHDLQRYAPIEDQFRICRDQAKREDWRIVGTFKDAAISAASVILRPGIQTLLQDAQRGESMSSSPRRWTGSAAIQADIATLFKHLRFAGVTIVTMAEGVAPTVKDSAHHRGARTLRRHTTDAFAARDIDFERC